MNTPIDPKNKPFNAKLATFQTEYFTFIEEFKDESDRAAVVLGGAKLDLLLGQVLKQYLIPVPAKKDDLFSGTGPLSTFSAKIAMSHRLGLIDSDFSRALHIIRKIRNDFAHEVSGCKLDCGGHRERVKELVAQLKHRRFFITIRSMSFKTEDDPSSNFRTALAILVGRLEFFLTQIKPIDNECCLAIFNERMLKED